jgi:RNA polymerase sigma factor (sigma-70 family)
MTAEPTRQLARQLLAAVRSFADGADDRELLARFAAGRDEGAFAELVRRHGPLVLGVCRRVTGHPQDAEDAFQAAFLVLARRAGQLKRPDLLGNWLYGVAYRTGLEARAARRRIAQEQQPVAAVPEPAAPAPPEDHADLRAVIDEELARLPDKYRAAVVLCDLEGCSRKDAAARLRVPEGTLSSRLAHARKVLAGRLTRRGVVASAGAVATTLTRDASAAAVPASLAVRTARMAAYFAAGAVPAGLVPTAVSTLTDGVMKAMIVSKLRLALGVLLAVGLLGLGAVGLTQQPPVVKEVADLTAGLQPRPKAGGKEKAAPEKIPAKGIEDDDVPYGTFPTQAVVRVEDGKLVVRQRTRGVHPVVREVAQAVVKDGENTEIRHKYVTYESKSAVTGYKVDAADVSVFDMAGNRLSDAKWKAKFKADTHVLVAHDGKLPHPRELSLFKEDTLLVVLPNNPVPPAGVTPATLYRLRQGSNGQFYYSPETSLAPPAPPAPPVAEVEVEIVPPAVPPTPAPPTVPGRPRSATPKLPGGD